MKASLPFAINHFNCRTSLKDDLYKDILGFVHARVLTAKAEFAVKGLKYDTHFVNQRIFDLLSKAASDQTNCLDFHGVFEGGLFVAGVKVEAHRWT